MHIVINCNGDRPGNRLQFPGEPTAIKVEHNIGGLRFTHSKDSAEIVDVTCPRRRQSGRGRQWTS